MFNDLNGFGIGSGADVQALNKALEGAESLGMAAGVSTPGIAIEGTTGGAALRVQSLDASLKVVTFTDRHINFWKDIPKTPAFSTIEEYNQMTSYGTQIGGFVTEGELPYTTQSDYLRKAALVKYIGTTRSVSHPMTLVRSMVPDVIAQENNNGIVWILKQLENALFWGRDKGRDAGEYVEFAGMDQMIGDNGNTYDMRNVNLATTPFTTIVNSLAQTVVDNYGFPTDIYLPFPLLAKINDEFAGTSAQRIVLPAPNGSTQLNINVDSLMTQVGRVNVKPVFFLQNTRICPTVDKLLNSTSMAAGSRPTYAVTDGGTKAANASYPTAGSYKAKVTLENKYGETAPLSVTGGQSDTAALNGTSETIRITLSANGGMADAEFINIFVTEPGGSTFYWVQKVALAAGSATYDWDATRLPNTYTSFIGQMTPDVITFRQLAPLVKMDLATIAPAYKWMLLLYGVPIIFTPLKWTRIINISL